MKGEILQVPESESKKSVKEKEPVTRVLICSTLG